MISRNCHFTHLIHFIFGNWVVFPRRALYLWLLWAMMNAKPVQSAEFNNASRLNNLQNSAIAADRLISLIRDSKRNQSNPHYFDLDALNDEASKLTSSALAPPLNDDLLFDAVNNYATLLKDADEIVLFILMNDSQLKPFSLITPIEDLASFGIPTDFSIDDNNLNFHLTDQAALFLWPDHEFADMEIGSFTSEVSGHIWHGKDKISFTDAGEMITGELRLSFQNEKSALLFLSSHGASSIYFSLGELTDFGTLSTTGNFIHDGEDRHAAISLGLLRANELDAFLQFKTDTDHSDHHFTGFVTTLPHAMH